MTIDYAGLPLSFKTWMTCAFVAVSAASSCGCLAQANPVAKQPWMDITLSTSERIDSVLSKMTLEEKVNMLHGTGQPGSSLGSKSANSNGGAGYMEGIPRLGVPGLQMADAAYGVTKSGSTGRYSTALPNNLALAATWNGDLAEEYGALIGRELRAQGYNMSLGGGVDLVRDLRNGRNFEYQGEDPILAGVMVGKTMKALQSEHVVGDLKHFAFNDQESGRNAVDVRIDERSMRETDLLAFQIGLRESQAGAVMCAYNRVNGDFSCENRHLLTDVLRTDWKFKGFVLSDWGGTHSTVKASRAGLDQEEPNEFFFGDALKGAVESGSITPAELDEHVRRILYAEMNAGLFDHPADKSVVDVEGGFDVAERVAAESIVLLKNDKSILPLQVKAGQTIAVIGAHADIAMLSGGGSAQVDPPGGNAIMPPGQGATHWMEKIWFPTSPLRELRRRFPQVRFLYDAGTDPASAAALAKRADLVLVFAHQWESEAMDLPTLALPDRQDDLIAAVTLANPKTVVVLETGSAVLMPWIDRVGGVVEAWYGGSRGAQALVSILGGDVNPSGKLPITFPASESSLPHARIVPPPPASRGEFYGKSQDEQNRKGFPAFEVAYDEGLKVGYKWYDSEKKAVLFPFGFGLSYTSFRYESLSVMRTSTGLTATLKVTNTGSRAGASVAQIYAALPDSAGEPPKRLVGWMKIVLNPGEARNVTVPIEDLFLSVYDTSKKGFVVVPGEYKLLAGGSSQELPLHAEIQIH